MAHSIASRFAVTHHSFESCVWRSCNLALFAGVFDCKPLGYIWAKFPEHYGPHNTIMLDDLRRNFVMNKQNGLVIRPFRKAHLTRATDRELVFLKQYLLRIGNLPDLSSLKHRRWERYLEGP